MCSHFLGKNPDEESQEEQKKEGQRKATSLKTNKNDVGMKELESLSDVVSNMTINGKAPISKPSASGQRSSDGSKENDLKSDPNSQIVPHKEGPKSSQAEVPTATAAANDPGVPPNPNSEASRDGVPGSDSPYSQELNVVDPAQAAGVVPPNPNTEASRDGVPGSESPDSQELKVADLAHPQGVVLQNPGSEASGDGLAGSDSPHIQELNLAGPTEVDGEAPPNPSSEASRDQGSASGHRLHHIQQQDAAAAVPPPPAADAAAAQPLPQNENNLESLTGAPIQEEAEGTVNEDTTGDETTQQEEAANSYESFFGK